MIEQKENTHKKAAGSLQEVSHRFAHTIPLKNAIRAPE